ncbi:ribosomal protein L11 methyltransferase-like [Clytia hemisphaerica]|uniref:Methyltransferase domain-containing protein n=1 Tax=Clytia hemisphaerica TaxID=252671 RepID=A0A7M5UTZ3_9CNID
MATEAKDKFFSGFEEARQAGKIIDYYNNTASVYNEALEQAGYTDTTVYCSTLLKEYLSGERGENKIAELEILDLGCGSGLTGVALQKVGFKLIDGVDPADKMLQVAREKSVYRNLSNGIITDTEKLSCYQNDSYDGLLCSGCFSVGHIRFNNGMPEVLRVLRKGGVAVYTIFSKMDCAVILNEHMPFFLRKQCEMLRVEKRFYFSGSNDKKYCDVYVIKKL